MDIGDPKIVKIFTNRSNLLLVDTRFIYMCLVSFDSIENGSRIRV